MVTWEGVKEGVAEGPGVEGVVEVVLVLLALEALPGVLLLEVMLRAGVLGEDMLGWGNGHGWDATYMEMC